MEFKETFCRSTFPVLVIFSVTLESSLAWASKLTRPSGVLKDSPYVPVMTTFRSVDSVSEADTALQEMSYSPASTFSGGTTCTVRPWLALDSTSIPATDAVSSEGTKLTFHPDGALEERL